MVLKGLPENPNEFSLSTLASVTKEINDMQWSSAYYHLLQVAAIGVKLLFLNRSTCRRLIRISRKRTAG